MHFFPKRCLHLTRTGVCPLIGATDSSVVRIVNSPVDSTVLSFAWSFGDSFVDSFVDSFMSSIRKSTTSSSSDLFVVSSRDICGDLSLGASEISLANPSRDIKQIGHSRSARPRDPSCTSVKLSSIVCDMEPDIVT